VEFDDTADVHKLLNIKSKSGSIFQTTYILAAIRMCVVENTPAELKELDFHCYSKLGKLDVVDMMAVQCLVGRVPDGMGWVIIDRSGSLARATINDDDKSEEEEVESE
jgi:hypothetical protein